MHTVTVKLDILKKNHVTITEKCFYTDVEFVLRLWDSARRSLITNYLFITIDWLEMVKV